ncbi:neuroglian isoform X2 [Hermetia illucens]|uniref:neuroglian isoform X2 n=1 Tax=Hermetia illucens TaxID=343691 RepID=UPI0018CC1621|nr:neuroglian isoform X2 [Hermetia illucens]
MLRQSLLLVVVTLTATFINAHNSPPHITKQPPTDEMLFKVAQLTKESDSPFTIECEAEGQPDPSYRWIKNGKRFDWQAYDNRMSQQPGRGTLLISYPKDEDMGQYQCFAENEFGIATSNSVFVRKAELNNFKDEATRTVEANEGEPFQLQCQPPDGWPKPNVHWLIQSIDGSIKSINNSRMTLDPEGNLWFSNVTRNDQSEDFYYACAATSVFRNEYKLGNRVLLNVVQTGISAAQNKYQPVKQYVTRKNEVALRGKRVEMYCIYGGTPLPQTVWSKDGQPIPWSDRITQGNYGKSLVIRHAIFEDAGAYTCDVSNGVGNAQSYSINLKILATPYFTVEPEIQNAAEDESIEFRCEASGVPEPTIKWIFNGKPISEAPHNPRRTVHTNSIVIKDLLKTDTGNYGCNATNSLGYVYKDVYLNVLALPPEIREAPRRESTVDRRNVTLTCRVFGAPKPEVKWIRNGLELTGGRYKTLESGDLQIINVGYADAGEYTCYAFNKFGTIDANGTLVVKEHTRITDGPQDYEVTAGNSATFRCNAVADSSLELKIEWWKDGQPIEFDKEARFVQTNDNSLTITKTMELDSGDYTCVAKTELDETQMQAHLIVQDVPNAPALKSVECNTDYAVITWEPKGDNRSPILHYTLQYNTSFTPDTWENAFEKVPATDSTFQIPMGPWANYTFRVIAYNKIGPSPPSKHGSVCTTAPDVPYKNPDNVEGKGTEPNNLVISWTPMPEIEHNAPNFEYRVSWKRDIPGANWENQDIYDWKQSSLLIPDQPTFSRYVIKVLAINEMGESNVPPKEVFGYSGEDVPTDAPTNFSMIQVTSSTSAVLSWNPVSNTSLRGHFKGYKIETWTEEEGEDHFHEVHVRPDSTQALVTTFKPNSKNYARILAYNSRFSGPPSATIDFDTPEGVPSAVQSFEAYPLGSSAFLLTWKKPLQPNGKLTGYKIYHQEVKGTYLEPKIEREPHIADPRVTRAKLAGLKPDTKYRVHITATTKMGEGREYFIEQKTLSSLAVPPDTPTFTWEQIPSDNGYAAIKVNWHPNLEGKPGSHFFTKYRMKDETNWLESKPEKNEDFQIIKGLDPDSVYEFRVVSADGDYTTESSTQEIDTNGVEGPIKIRNENVATAGWFIGMMLAIAFLLLLLIIICIIKRNRGGKYDVHDRELANGRRDYPDEGGFHEYSQPVGRQSVASNPIKPGPESDTDSMAEYGEGDTGQFTEDGSFIGQYVPGKLQPPVSPQPVAHNQPIPQTSSQGTNAVATYV